MLAHKLGTPYGHGVPPLDSTLLRYFLPERTPEARPAKCDRDPGNPKPHSAFSIVDFAAALTRRVRRVDVEHVEEGLVGVWR